MTSGILNLSAGPFLVFYVMVSAISIVAAILVKQWIRESGPSQSQIADLSVLEIALLAGGRARAADVLVLGMIETGHLTVESSGQLAATTLYRDAPPQISPFRSEAYLMRQDLVAVMRPWLDSAVGTLTARGLALSDKVQFRMKAAVFATVTPVILLGLIRLNLGVHRGKPVGFLIGLIILTIFAAFVASGIRRLATGWGEQTLSRLSVTKARAVRAPLPHEVLFAFAMVGPAALAGTALAAYATTFDDDSGAGSSSGGEGGGGGCGGCGGGD